MLVSEKIVKTTFSLSALDVGGFYNLLTNSVVINVLNVYAGLQALN